MADMDTERMLLRYLCSAEPLALPDAEELLETYRGGVLEAARRSRTDGAHDLWTALGGDHVASRTVNALVREFGRTPSVDDLRQRRYDLRDIRTIGAASLARIDKLINEETTS